MAENWCLLFASLALLLHSACSLQSCRPASMLPGFQPSLSPRAIETHKSRQGLSWDECAELCCREKCTMAYIRDTVCFRFVCKEEDPVCTWKRSKPSRLVILPSYSDDKYATCSLETPTGCGLNEVCTSSDLCRCRLPIRRSSSGLCLAHIHSGTQTYQSAVTEQPTHGFHLASTTHSPSSISSEATRPDAATASSGDLHVQPTIAMSTAAPVYTTVVRSGDVDVSSSPASLSTQSPERTASHTGSVTTAALPPSTTASPSQLTTSTTAGGAKSTTAPLHRTVVLSTKSDKGTPAVVTTPSTTLSNKTSTLLPLEKPTAALPHQPATEPPPKPAVRVLHISAGANREITLPTDEVTVFATIFPAPKDKSGYEYDWTLIGGPDGGQIEHPHTESARLYDLITGIYRLHLQVRGPDSGIGEDSVNITVHPKPRLNKPPVAVVSPQSVRVHYPQSTVVLDASQSHDEFDTELKYHWVEVLWPLNKHLGDYDDTHRSVLKLRVLEVGDYKLKLIVTDSNGAEGSALVNITVLEERDDPPVALAGEPQVIQLPVNEVWLNGSHSDDDKGIVSYIWKKLKGPAGNDQSGSSSPYLHLTGLVAGDYLYQLTVTDKRDQSASSTVSVVVKPANEKPPHVEAGNDMESVAHTIDLVGRAWMGDNEANGCLGCSYSWKMIKSPPHGRSQLTGNRTLKLHVTQMIPGQYVFRLTATSSQGKIGSAAVTLTIRNAADVNKPPIANAGADVTIRLPNHMAMLDGSKSQDVDDDIHVWKWERSPDSPAVGDIANTSDLGPLLKLSNLVAGTYQFTLTVSDSFGVSSLDSALINVLPAAVSLRDRLFEIEIKEAASQFTENDKKLLVSKVATALGSSDASKVHVYAVDSRLGKVSLVMYVVADNYLINWTANAAVKRLRASQSSLNLNVRKSTVNVERVNTFYCLNNCSNHGNCEPLSKQCICDTLWMQNPLRAHFGEHVANCDWNLLYVGMVNMAILAGAIALCCCCYRTYTRCSKRKAKIRTPKKRGYALLKRAKSDEDISVAMLPHVGDNGVLRSHSDSEELLFDTTSLMAENAERRSGSKKKSNGKLANGSM